MAVNMSRHLRPYVSWSGTRTAIGPPSEVRVGEFCHFICIKRVFADGFAHFCFSNNFETGPENTFVNFHSRVQIILDDLRMADVGGMCYEARCLGSVRGQPGEEGIVSLWGW